MKKLLLANPMRDSLMRILYNICQGFFQRLYSSVNRGFFLGHEYGGVFDQFFSIRNGEEGWKIPYLTIKEG